MPSETMTIQRVGWLAGLLLALRLFDLVIVAGSALLAYWSRNGLTPLPDEEAVAVALGTMLALVIFSLGSPYHSAEAPRFWRMSARILSLWALAFLFLLAAGFMIKVSGDFSRLWAGSWFALCCLGLVAARFAVARRVRRARRRGELATRVAIIGADELGVQLFHHLMLHDQDVQVVGVFDDRMEELRTSAAREGMTIQGRIADIIPWAANRQVDGVIIALPWVGEKRLTELVSLLQGLAVQVQICPEGLGFMMRSFPTFRNSYASTVGGLPMFTLQRRPLDGWNWLIKRVEDKVLALLLLPVAIPVCALIALAIRLDSPGPVLFKQVRRGFNGRNFQVYKFRSMRLETCETDGETHAATRRDPRVTRVGAFLRRTSLDELPQLLNVLREEMSIIGPRPHALSHDRQFGQIVHDYYARNRMLPGMTGWAQINGLRGSVETPQQLRERVNYDLWYIENWSVLLDLRILLLTPFMGLIHRNAY